MRTSLTQLTPSEIDELLQITAEEVDLDLDAIVKVGIGELLQIGDDDDSHGDPVYYHPAYAIRLFAADPGGNMPERLQFKAWSKPSYYEGESDIEHWEIQLGEIIMPMGLNVAPLRVTKWFLDHGFKLWSDQIEQAAAWAKQQSETPEMQQVSEAVRDEVLHVSDKHPPADNPMRKLTRAAIEKLTKVMPPTGTPMPLKPQVVSDMRLLTAYEALRKIREAGYNEDSTAQWMQEWAAYGLGVNCPYPPEKPPAPEEPTASESAEDFADRLRGRNLRRDEVDQVLATMRIVFGEEATQAQVPVIEACIDWRQQVSAGAVREPLDGVYPRDGKWYHTDECQADEYGPYETQAEAEDALREYCRVVLDPGMIRTDDDLRAWWREHGGKFHGPKVETGAMPEERLLPLLRTLLAGHWDDPELDLTDGAHPAWWRGNDAGVHGALDRVKEALDGKYDGETAGPYFGSQRLMDVVQRIMQLRQWVNDLQSGLHINCVYCGHRYGPGESGAVPAEALNAHIRGCPKHPLSKAIKVLQDIEKQAIEAEALGEHLDIVLDAIAAMAHVVLEDELGAESTLFSKHTQELRNNATPQEDRPLPRARAALEHIELLAGEAMSNGGHEVQALEAIFNKAKEAQQ